MNDRTILFADIAGSTALYETIGDARAEALISKVLENLSTIVVQQGGSVIKTIGDELMCQFPSADQSVQAAVLMHEWVARQNARGSGPNLSVRIGAHVGSVIDSQGDVYGDTVNVSARIAALARPGKTMISEQTFEALNPDLQQSCRFMMESYVKGKEQPLRIYDAVWEKTDELTRLASTPRTRASGAVMVVSYGDHSTRLEQGAIRIGRGTECDLVVEAPQASRCHCEIRHTGNKFTLTDSSTNGTFVLQNDVELFFHNETVPLLSSGLLSLGQNSAGNAEHLIEFVIEAADA